MQAPSIADLAMDLLTPGEDEAYVLDPDQSPRLRRALGHLEGQELAEGVRALVSLSSLLRDEFDCAQAADELEDVAASAVDALEMLAEAAADEEVQRLEAATQWTGRQPAPRLQIPSAIEVASGPKIRDMLRGGLASRVVLR